MILTPPALSFSLETKREGLTVYLWPALGSMILAVFYQGGMQLINAMEYPFGSDLDDLHPDWLLMSTERAVFSFLAENLPPQLAVVPATFDKAAATRAEGSPGDRCGGVRQGQARELHLAASADCDTSKAALPGTLLPLAETGVLPPLPGSVPNSATSVD
mmetsp:Transcript_147774/g.384216  ORF Transcript_147774/g.384216 Transcript_147774/m.384216 type:complete len:160 (+) Transcript_147774:2-481(+)